MDKKNHLQENNIPESELSAWRADIREKRANQLAGFIETCLNIPVKFIKRIRASLVKVK